MDGFQNGFHYQSHRNDTNCTYLGLQLHRLVYSLRYSQAERVDLDVIEMVKPTLKVQEEVESSTVDMHPVTTGSKAGNL